MRAFDVILFVLLLVGNLLALPIWAWLFGTPLVQLWRWSRTGLAHLHKNRKRKPPPPHRPPHELNQPKRSLVTHPVPSQQPHTDMAPHSRRLAEREISIMDDAPSESAAPGTSNSEQKKAA